MARPMTRASLTAIATAALEKVLKEEKNIQVLESLPNDSDLVRINYTFLEISEKELLEQQNNPKWFETRFRNHLRRFREERFDYSSGSIVYARIEEPEQKAGFYTKMFGVTFLCYSSR